MPRRSGNGSAAPLVTFVGVSNWSPRSKARHPDMTIRKLSNPIIAYRRIAQFLVRTVRPETRSPQ
jgi:hypothetical protein